MKKNINYCTVAACPSAKIVNNKMLIVGKKTQPTKNMKIAKDEVVIEVPVEIIKKALEEI